LVSRETLKENRFFFKKREERNSGKVPCSRKKIFEIAVETGKNAE